jgi:cytochrome c
MSRLALDEKLAAPNSADRLIIRGDTMRKTDLIVATVMLAATANIARADAPKPWEGGDAAAGAVVFKKCQLCHYGEAGKTKIGPSLWQVVGRPSGSLPGYTYSTAMKSYNHVWTPENLFNYLQAPMKVVKGTKMTFVGLPSETDRKNVIAYLETLK